MRALSGLAALMVASVVACGGGGGAGEPSSSSSSAIQSTPSTTVDAADAFAVAVIERTPLGKVVCSGVLLAPNLVATARHCVAAVAPASGAVDCATSTFGAPVPPGDLSVTTDAEVTPTSDVTGVTEVIVPTGPDQVKVCGNDIALLVLDRPTTRPTRRASPRSATASTHRRTPRGKARASGASSRTLRCSASPATRPFSIASPIRAPRRS